MNRGSEKLVLMDIHETYMNVSRHQPDSCCLTERVLDMHLKQKQMERIQLQTRYETNYNYYRFSLLDQDQMNQGNMRVMFLKLMNRGVSSFHSSGYYNLESSDPVDLH